ncbi:hypothetical protein Tco_0752518 [Tanacetum coccineum]|uniref:Tf2-1-like SH3-like domain-containing protein n=1 Tax=Tanacetum coccineum TaxID=301880 RepID=A0ABQ4ZAF8_9ASTR
MQSAHDRQKSYIDLKHKPIEFRVGDKVMLKVSPWKGVVRFGKRGQLNPRYVRPFKVLEQVGSVAYKLELPKELSMVHNTFHVSNLKKCYANEPLAVPLDGLQFDDKLHFVEEPVEIMDRGNGYSLKDKNNAKTDKTEHRNGKSVKSQSQSQNVKSGHDTHVYCEGGQDDPAPAQAPPPPPATARTMPQRMARLEEDVHEIRRTLAE